MDPNLFQIIHAGCRYLRVVSAAAFCTGAAGGEDFLQDRPHVLRDVLLAGGVGMDLVRLIEAGHTAHAFEEKGDQLRFVRFRDAREEGAEFFHKIRPHIGRHLHAGDDDRQAGALARARWMMPVRFSSVCCGTMPRNPSLPPSAMTSTSAPPARTQLIRRNPPAVVSPLTPALTTSKGSPAASIFCCRRAGQAAAGSSRPRPAVMLSPSTTMRPRAGFAPFAGAGSAAHSGAPVQSRQSKKKSARNFHGFNRLRSTRCRCSTRDRRARCG